MKTKEAPLAPIALDSYRPLRDLVFESLKDAILTQTLPPGKRLLESELAESLGVSRTPVREAIRRLEQEGLVAMIPRKGAYVSGISLKDIREVYEIRAALEMLALELAAKYITAEEIAELEHQVRQEEAMTEANRLNEIIFIDSSFHDLIYQYARNSRLTQFVEILQEQFKRFRFLPLGSSARSHTALAEHEQMVEALRAHDSILAAKLAREHIANAQNALISALTANGLIGNDSIID